MATFIRLTDYKSSEEKRQAFDDSKNRYEVNTADFKKIPGSPIAYWVEGKDLFANKTIGDAFFSGGRNKTHNNEKYVRFGWEVSSNSSRWVSYANGSDFRKYAGSEIHVVDWSVEAKEYYDSHGGLCNKKFWDKKGLTWALITSAINSFRIKPDYSLYSSGSPTIFNESYTYSYSTIAFLNSPIAKYYLVAINPTLNTTVSDVFALPLVGLTNSSIVDSNTENCISMSKFDWNSFETSWDFEALPIISYEHKGDTLEASYGNWREFGKAQTAEMKRLEEENNRIFIDAYGLQNELTPDVPIEQITLTVNPAYRYGKDKTDEEYEELFRTDSMKELISYSIGCMMGRYSLDEKGLIYAHSGNEGFDHSKYTTFPADEDGIIPLTDLEWFPDDATNRFIEFIEKVWGKDTKEQNLKFVADSLSPKRGETPEQTIRRYMSANFFKDHMKRYKKRPIYWLFSSGKEKAFEALVYLHRYNESTLSRMRSEYVNPLQTNMNAYLTRLDKSLEDSSLSSSEQKKLEKEREVLIKKITELRTFDEQLKHYADQRISIDLDDGVKVNYGKFGDLLAEVKNISGGKDED